GATDADIESQFLTEAVLIGATGGIAGVLLGVGSGLLAHLLLPSIPVSFMFWHILVAFWFSLLAGVVFGIYPARRASRLDPVAALRYE
ncbi:MAG: FtsX-like permease family protein, partial [Planctomycetota bacterium]